jgi:hypothetical protein
MMTSRNVSRRQLSPQTHLQLGVVSLDELVEPLVRGMASIPSEPARETVTGVARELGCHPIALVQAISHQLHVKH